MDQKVLADCTKMLNIYGACRRPEGSSRCLKTNSGLCRHILGKRGSEQVGPSSVGLCTENCALPGKKVVAAAVGAMQKAAVKSVRFPVAFSLLNVKQADIYYCYISCYQKCISQLIDQQLVTTSKIYHCGLSKLFTICWSTWTRIVLLCKQFLPCGQIGLARFLVL